MYNTKKNPVWYFDATGSVLVNVIDEKQPLLYSIVAHDFDKNTIIPIGEFCTTLQSDSISSYLRQLKKILERQISESSYFTSSPIIVTDFSWALINSVLDTFNNCSITQYLNWTYDVLIKQSGIANLNHLMKTKIILCSTHMLKLFIKKLKLIKTSKKKVLQK